MGSTTVFIQAAVVGAAAAAAAVYFWPRKKDGDIVAAVKDMSDMDVWRMRYSDPVKSKLLETTKSFVKHMDESLQVSMDPLRSARERKEALENVISHYTVPVAVVRLDNKSHWALSETQAVLTMSEMYPGVVLVDKKVYEDIREKWILSLKVNGVFDCVDTRHRGKGNGFVPDHEGKIKTWSHGYDIYNKCLKNFDPNQLQASYNAARADPARNTAQAASDDS